MNATNSFDPSSLSPREWCAAYLLGDLTDSQITEFESCLEQPMWANALEDEARLLMDLAEFEFRDRQVVNVSDHVAANELSPVSAHHRPTLIVMAALAAALIIAVGVAFHRFSGQSASPSIASTIDRGATSTTFELEIAKTWAQPAVIWSDENHLLNENDSEDSPIGLDDFEMGDDSVQWLVAAVEAFESGDSVDD